MFIKILKLLENLMADDLIEEELPQRVEGDKVIRKYTRGRLLGKGGFAKCYEITNHDTG